MGAGLGASPEVGRKNSGRSGWWLSPCWRVRGEKFTVSQPELWWKGRYWGFMGTLSILHPNSKKQLLAVPHSKEWAMKPHVISAVPHAAQLKLTLSEVNASTLTDCYNSLTSRCLILFLGPRPPANTLGDVKLWFSDIYNTECSFLFSFCTWLCCTLEWSFPSNYFSSVFPYGSVRI